jgi:hypothetical protein
VEPTQRSVVEHEAAEGGGTTADVVGYEDFTGPS